MSEPDAAIRLESELTITCLAVHAASPSKPGAWALSIDKVSLGGSKEALAEAQTQRKPPSLISSCRQSRGRP